MAGLQVMYSKEVAKELTKIAVVLPGAPVEVGQIIHFPFGRRGIWPFRKPAPRGAFNVITTLSNLNVTPQISESDPDGDPYIFSSRRTVKIDADFGGQGNIAAGTNAEGSLTASFESEGSVYFAAIDCATTRITNLDQIQVDLEQHTNQIVWNETFLVTSVTVAKKALIMQSSTKSASLNVAGDVKGLVTRSGADISANAEIGVRNFKESSFIKPWSDNVTVFIGLHRFTKNTFGFQPESAISRMSPFETAEVNKMAGELVNSDDDKFSLEQVSALEILDDQDFNELA